MIGMELEWKEVDYVKNEKNEIEIKKIMKERGMR